MQERASEAQVDTVIARLIELGMDVHRSSGATRTVLGVVGAHKIDPELIGLMGGVHEVLRISEPYKRASRTFRPENSVVIIDDVRIGGDEVIVMAGPCSAETEEQLQRPRIPRARARARRAAPAPPTSRAGLSGAAGDPRPRGSTDRVSLSRPGRA
jgi:3-deoxy-7-phosphoheptulonate synthase